MKPLDLQAEAYVATGNIASEGMRNQLGRPRVDRLALLVREATQNTWDAKAANADRVRFGMAVHELSPNQCRVLRDVVFRETPPPGAVAQGRTDDLGQSVRHPQDAIASGEPVRMLLVYDRGTTGLGGPTRANQFSAGSDARDFVDFFRNVGTPPDTAQGGGTFGYGKAALYLASSAQTILVHTRARVNGTPTSRFMVSGLSNRYAHAQQLFTGRHWWGRRAADGIVDPVDSAEADELAHALGFPPIDGDECGTTIGILAPDFDLWDGDPQKAIEYVRLQLLHNFWPKLIPWPGEAIARMQIEAGWNGRIEPIPNPTDVFPYSAFVPMLEAARGSEVEDSEEGRLYCLRPKRLLGRFAVEKTMVSASPLEAWREWESFDGILDRLHHVALLRRPEQVVTYHAGPPLPIDEVGYAGIFLAGAELDRVYAGAEPPTHDSWNPEILNDKQAKTFVRTTFKRLRERLADLARPQRGFEVEMKPGAKLARLADRMGQVLIGVGGERPTEKIVTDNGNEPGVKKSRNRASVRLREGSLLENVDGRLTRVFTFDVAHAKGRSFTRIEAEPMSALLGGGLERDPPAGAETVRVLGWKSPSGVEWEGSPVFDADEEGAWGLRVNVPVDASIAMRLRVVDSGG